MGLEIQQPILDDCSLSQKSQVCTMVDNLGPKTVFKGIGGNTAALQILLDSNPHQPDQHSPWQGQLLEMAEQHLVICIFASGTMKGIYSFGY